MFTTGIFKNRNLSRLTGLGLSTIFTFAAILLTSTAADAQWRNAGRGQGGPPPWAQNDRRGNDRWDRDDDRWNGRDRRGNQSYRFAFDRGYKDGYKDGKKAAKRGNYGWGNYGGRGNHRGWGNDYRFQAAYREGYERGYRDGYYSNRRYDGRYTNRRPGTIFGIPLPF
jgi:hypothetical protein